MLLGVRLWILFSAVLVGAGWILSALHALNRAGYGIVIAITIAAVAGWWCKTQQPTGQTGRLWNRFRKRFRHPAPILFGLLLLLAFLSGAIYAPVPGDASMYRTPRVQHWLAVEHWHWIRTVDSRLNTRGCGFEWLTAPLMLFTHTDRLFFLINLISFALLPGIVFSFLRQLQVRGRVAWWWMWLLPAGWCYALQAGSLANDSFAVIYAMAAVVFALRAKKNGNITELWFSLLSAALMTGVKQTLIPLALLWPIAAWPSLRLLWTRPLASFVVACAGWLVSAAPIICLNLRHDFNWAGVARHPDPLDPWRNLVELHSPVWGVIGNSFYLLLQNFTPLFFPVNKQWNYLMDHFTHTPFGAHFASFQRFCQMPSCLTEQTSGLGVMTCLLLLLSFSWAWHWRRNSFVAPAPAARDRQIKLLWLAPWGLLLLFMAKVGSIETARLLSSYYPFLLPPILALAAMPILVRQRWWQRLALLTMLGTALVLVAMPSRPLWPAGTVLHALAQRHPSSNAILRIQSLYSTPAIDQMSRHVFQSDLPADESVVGYATDVQGLEPGLWLPFHRRVERVLPADTREVLAALGIHYVVVGQEFLRLRDGSIENLLQRYNAQLVNQLPLPGGWKAPPNYVYLLRLN